MADDTPNIRTIEVALLSKLLEQVDSTLKQVDINVAQANQTLDQLKTQRAALAGQKSILTDLIKAAK